MTEHDEGVCLGGWRGTIGWQRYGCHVRLRQAGEYSLVQTARHLHIEQTFAG